MTSIQATTLVPSNRLSNLQKRWDEFKSLAKRYAGIIDSRESTYRLALDLTAFDIPILCAAGFRNFWNFLEAIFEAGLGTLMVYGAPRITTFVGRIASKFILPKEEQKNGDFYLKFHMNEVAEALTQENNKTQQGVNRILAEEPKDLERIAEIYEEAKKNEKALCFKSRAQETRDFFNRFKPTEEMRKLIYKLKKAVIIGESAIEGGVWGSFGLLIRLFRKYIIRKERFTGTMGYLGDAESSKLNEGGELSLLQKIWGIGVIFLSPILNTILLNKTEKKETVSKNRFLKITEEHLDMTHGIYPKLGLLFTYTSMPKWTGTFITSQGWLERIERIFKFCTILPSWWLGHRITNGRLALSADKYLSRKYGIKEGILVDEQYLQSSGQKSNNILDKINSLCPEPARIQHVLDKVEESSKNLEETKREQFLEEAKELHAKTLYRGFALHSFLVWVVTMAVNYTTKLRVMRALGK